MTTDTDPFDDMSINDVAALTERVARSANLGDAQEATPESLGVDLSPTTSIPRSVKLTATLDRQCKARATALGMSQSEYIRSLIERDVAEGSAAGEADPVVALVHARAELDRAIAQLSNHAA